MSNHLISRYDGSSVMAWVAGRAASGRDPAPLEWRRSGEADPHV